MRIRLIALIAGLSLCSSALAQEESAPPAAEPAAEPAAASPAPAPAADTTEKAPAPAARPAAPRPSKPAASARPARVPSSLESDPEAAARHDWSGLPPGVELLVGPDEIARIAADANVDIVVRLRPKSS